MSDYKIWHNDYDWVAAKDRDELLAMYTPIIGEQEALEYKDDWEPLDGDKPLTITVEKPLDDIPAGAEIKDVDEFSANVTAPMSVWCAWAVARGDDYCARMVGSTEW